MPQEPCHPGKSAEPDCIMQLSCEEVQVMSNNQNMENFNDRGTKMILLLEELLLIATNSKGFANRRKSIIIKETI